MRSMRAIDGTVINVRGVVVGHKVGIELSTSTMRPARVVALSPDDVTCLIHDLEAERAEALHTWNRRSGDAAVAIVDEHDPQGPMPRRAPDET